MAENLVEVDYRGLTLQEALQALLDKKVLVIPADGHWREEYWQIFDISVNALSTYPCYVYDAETANKAPKFLIGTTVYYTSKMDSTRDSAIVIGLYKDEEGNWHYKLSRDQEIYAETELTADRL